MAQTIKNISILISLFILIFYSNTKAQQLEIPNAGELQIALEKLNVLGSVLYLAAHPDDENTGLLAYLSKGRKLRTAYLSLTRGSGGQNLIGSEKGAEIGLIRTQELLAARQIDGADQFFTRAMDFGYSKTAEESFEFWNKEKVLADVVWIIRKFRPDVIITRFTPDGYSGHGHHTASAMLAVEAFSAAADPGEFPEQLQFVAPWRAKRLCWNSWRPDADEIKDMPKVNTGEYNPLLGQSYTEIAALSRSKHKSQGFGATGRRGMYNEYFAHLAGTPAKNDLLDGMETSWARVPGGKKIGDMLSKIFAEFKPGQPEKSLPSLLEVLKQLNTLENSHWLQIKKTELLSVIRGCAGLWLEAIADDFAAAPGDKSGIKLTFVNRSDFPLRLQKISYPGITEGPDSDILLKNNAPINLDQEIQIPADYPISQPYWLQEEPLKGAFNINDQQKIGLAENPPSIAAQITLNADGTMLEYSIPVLFRWRDQVAGELYRQFEVRPPVTMNLESKVNIFIDNKPKKIRVKIKSHTPSVSGEVVLNGNKNWRVKPSSIPFSLNLKYEEKQIAFEIQPPKNPDEAQLTVKAKIDRIEIDNALVEISYPHIKQQVYFPKSQFKAVKLDLKKQELRIGYIIGAGDEVPDVLRNLDYEVILLDDEMLETGDLAEFDAIVAGVRAYNTRERLKYTRQRLLKYVADGGTFIVQYNVSRGLQTDEIGPYSFTISHDRVSDENAAVILLNPSHPLLTFPNKITQADFEGWVQERGLYFANQWDGRYETILSAHDANEPAKTGGMLFAKYGKGVFIYSGYSWFRQLPAGVPGAIRLFVNLISAGKKNEE